MSMWIVVFASAICVYWDATENKIGKIPNQKGFGFFNISAGMWAFGTLICWILVIPAYLIKRGSLIEIAKESPVEVKGRPIKLTLMSAMCLFIAYSVFQYHADQDRAIKAAAYQSSVDSELNQLTSDSLYDTGNACNEKNMGLTQITTLDVV